MDPATGTFTTMDTYGGSLSDPMSLHKYLFANSNPVMYTDPSGHFSLAEMDAAMAIDIMLDSSYISGFLYIVDASITDPELEHHDIMGYFGAVGFGFIFSGLSLILSSFVTGALVLAVINTVFASMGVAKGIQDFDNGHVVYGPLEAVVSVVGCAIGWNNFTNVWCAQQTSELISVKGRGTGSDDAYIDYVGKEIDAWYDEQCCVSDNNQPTKINYREVFFNKYPELKGEVIVHHSVEQQVLNKPQTKGLFSYEEIHSIENLRGIPNSINSDLHLSIIRKEWNRFYKEYPNPTRQQVLYKASEIDAKYGHLFLPPFI